MDDSKRQRLIDETDVLREELASHEEDLEEKCEREQWEQTVAEAMWTERTPVSEDST